MWNNRGWRILIFNPLPMQMFYCLALNQEKRLYWNLVLSREYKPNSFLAVRRLYKAKHAEFLRRLARKTQHFVNHADPFKKVYSSERAKISSTMQTQSKRYLKENDPRYHQQRRSIQKGIFKKMTQDIINNADPFKKVSSRKWSKISSTMQTYLRMTILN